MSDLSPPQHASTPPADDTLTPDSTDNTPTDRPEGGAEAPVEGSGEGHAEAVEQGRGEETGESQESSDDSPNIEQQPSEMTESAPRQASPATSVAASGTSTPPLGPLPKKKFAAINVNQKFLQKTASPVPAPGAVKTNGRQTASPVPILPAPSRHLSTKLNTMTAKPPPAPAPPPTTNSSPWAKPANVAEGDTLHQPAPTKLRVGGVLPPAATGASAANTSNAWRTSAGPPKHFGLTRDFPTAKEVADSKRAAAAVEEATAAATAAHNQAILQELNSFTQLDPHAHRWDEDSDEDEFNLPPAPPPPQPQKIQRDDIPVSKSDRFASDDFDRSWPRRPTGERVLFDAGISRGAPVPPVAPAQSAQGGQGWNPRLMGRGDNWRERSAASNGPAPSAPSAPGISRNLPPHLTDAPTDREKDAQKPAAPEPAAVPPRQLGRWDSVMQAESGSTGRTGWGSRATEERAPPPHVPAPTPSAAPVPPRRSFIGVRPSPPTSNSSLPHVQPPHSQPPPSTLPPVEDEQHQEMHTAAEKARLRRLEEEKEREAAKERARKKAKELEERMMAKAPAPAAAKEVKEDKDEAKSVRPTSIAQRPKDLGLPQRPSRSPAGFASEIGKDKERESRAETESSWRVRAPSSQATRAEENKDEIVTPPVAIPVSTEVLHPAELALDGELDRSTPHAPSSSSFDGMLDRIKAAMSKMQEEKDQPKDAGLAPASPVKKEEAKEERKVILEREKKPPTEPRADRLSAAPLPPAQPQPQAKPIPTAPKAKAQPPTISVPTFFDISYPAPPRSPPPAWRTMTIRVPKFDLAHRTPVPKAQMDSFFAPLNYPKGWARSFNPPLELHQRALFGPGNRPPPRENEGVVDRSRLLLPAGRVKTKEGEVVVSISPRVLTRSRPRKMGVDGEVGGKSSVIAPPAAEQESGDAVTRKRSPSARSAAQAEKSGSGYILQGVGLTISPPPGVSLPSSLSLGTALDQSETEEGGADDRKGGVRFLVSSELEGDSLLEEVNKMSLESVEEEEGKDGEEPPKTSGIAQSPESNGPSTPWAQSSLGYGHSQHDAIKSVWESDSKPTPAPISSTTANPPTTSSSALSETPMYPSINTPSNSDVGAGTQPLSSSFVAAPGPSASGFSPQLGSAPFTRHPSNQSQSAQTASLHSHNPSQGQSPYFGSPHAHSLTSPDPTGGAYAGMGMSTMGRMGMGMGVPLGYTSRPMGSSAVGHGGWQQNVWGGFNAMNGYGYTQAPQQTHHQTQPGQGKDKAYQSYAGQQAQQPTQGYGVPGYPRMNPAPAQAPGYTFTPGGYSSHTTHATSPQVRPQGRFAQANGDYARQAQQQQQQQAVGQGGNGFRMSASSGDGAYYGDVSGYAPKGQTGSSQSQPQGAQSGQSGAQGSFGRSTRGGLQRRVW
ncbi:hypothetical protein B9479_004019 [Cryptococcus floricola]|uniref:Uncharacterized protein n=1 Tax=Cryptococcus floricola TaxID=2591691 RepID=A0A5D3AV50_9TREE|nr:hypothetical protein B9479_004019 [Cryptococcus floricola]